MINKYINMARLLVNKTLGLDVVHFAGQHTLRAHLVNVFNAYKIDAVIDVGANEGQFGLFMRSLGFSGDIYSFEPVAGAYKSLSAIAENDKRWFVFNYALGAQSGESFINVSEFSVFSSILNINEYALEKWSNSKTVHQQKITIKTLDECAAEGVFNRGGRFFFLKMDTQGYDLEVFKGARTILPNINCMLSELSLIHIYEGMPSFAESLTAFEGAGFSVSGFYPITRNKNTSLNEVDCVLVK